MASYTRQIAGIMDCTSALVETVNYDIKTEIGENFGRLARSENIHQIEKICEEQEPCKAFYDVFIEGEENIKQRKPEIVISLFDYKIVTESSDNENVHHEIDIFDDWDWS
jgi:hypothetical protein